MVDQQKLMVLLHEFDDDVEFVATTVASTTTVLLDVVGGDVAAVYQNPAAHVQNYVEEIVPRYSDVQFREHFRMSRTTFEVGVGVSYTTQMPRGTGSGGGKQGHVPPNFEWGNAPNL